VSLLRHGQLAEALRVSERIALVAPLDTFFLAQHTKDIYSTRHYEQTLEAAERVRVLIPDFYDLEEAWAYAKLGRLQAWYDTRLALFEQCGTPCDPIREAQERGWAEGGPAGALRARIDAFKDAEAWPSRSFFIAVGYAQLGDTDEALAWLERGYREHESLMYITSVSPFFDAIRVDPRFDDLLHRISFPETPDPAVLADVGGTLAFAGRAEEAIARLDKALHLAPEDERLPRWRYYMAMAHFAAERYEQSVRWAQRALEDQTSSHSLAFAHLLLASSNAYLGQLDEAQESLAEALRLWPGVAIKRDLYSLFMAGDPTLRDRYLDGLRKAGMEG
jgi:tetratricopeptide (TPR) repeat protein